MTLAHRDALCGVQRVVAATDVASLNLGFSITASDGQEA
jgi:hypothetical protein